MNVNIPKIKKTSLNKTQKYKNKITFQWSFIHNSFCIISYYYSIIVPQYQLLVPRPILVADTRSLTELCSTQTWICWRWVPARPSGCRRWGCSATPASGPSAHWCPSSWPAGTGTAGSGAAETCTCTRAHTPTPPHTAVGSSQVHVINYCT